ncbi:MAG: GTPase HflX [Clostridium sp.]|nr:GTPase HflX [Clostridium sp.]MCM1398793.1 GTPase HflX [Clostridium sp.]MCM1458575.1 GTPase HflX [Bacteroides sp.]
MYNTDKEMEKVILIAVDLDKGEDIDANLDELEDLVKTAGAVVVGRLIQKKEAVDKATYIGSGKTEELKALVAELDASGIVSDDELSPMQMKNLEEFLDTKIMDRTMVILDIFAKRATTREGIIQVELAQLKYRSSRLIGMRNSLSRLGGGIGTRGPGEKKLEIDRRIIRDRIGQLQKELEDVKQHREVMRKQRMSGNLPIVSIVGYTNAGKSTLLNKLTLAGVLEEDMLFATLDPTSRGYKLANGQEIIITDTVGFIKKLPHHLINAFRSTLEEAKYSDIILHVVDISSPCADTHIATVYETLGGLGVENKPVITAFNKIDKVETIPVIKDFKADHVVYIAAKKEMGFEELIDAITDEVNKSRNYIEKLVPYSEAGILNKIRKTGSILEEDYREDGIYIRAYADKSLDI